MKLFCWHNWEVAGAVGFWWKETLGVKIPSKCSKCGKLKDVPSYHYDEIPEEFMCSLIQYRFF